MIDTDVSMFDRFGHFLQCVMSLCFPLKSMLSSNLKAAETNCITENHILKQIIGLVSFGPVLVAHSILFHILQGPGIQATNEIFRLKEQMKDLEVDIVILVYF